MNKETLKQAFSLFFVSLILACAAYVFHDKGESEKIQGSATFGMAAGELDRLSTIQIISDKNTITLDKSDGLWLLREADSYYANYQNMNALEDFIKTSKILRAENLTPDEEKKYFSQNGRTIKLYSATGAELAEIVLSTLKAGNDISYAKIKGLNGTYVIENKINFPTDIALWLQQPLLNLQPDMIKNIRINSETFTRENKNDVYLTQNNLPYNANKITKPLELLLFTKVLSAQNFDDAKYPEQKEIELTTFDGLVINLTLYKGENDYWLKQKISTTTLPTTAVSDYVKNNAFLYDYWYFKLSQSTGVGLWIAQ